MGLLADRYGRKPIIVASLILFGLAGSAIAFTTNFYIALGFRLVQAVGFGGLTSIFITSIGDIYTGSQEATTHGLRFTGSGMAQTILPLISGLTIAIAWNYPFLLSYFHFQLPF